MREKSKFIGTSDWKNLQTFLSKTALSNRNTATQIVG